jgi:hypothetical protein
MALYVQVDINFFSSKKIIKGARILGITTMQFGAHMIALWAWSMTNAKDGILNDLEAEDIATASGYSEDAEKFLQTIIRVGFVDKSEVLTLHNWQERSGKILELQEKDRIRAKEKYTKKTGESTENPKSLPGESVENPKVSMDSLFPNLTKLNLTKLNLTEFENTNTGECEGKIPASADAGSPGGEPITHLEPEALKKKVRTKKELPFPITRTVEIWNEYKSAKQMTVDFNTFDAKKKKQIEKRILLWKTEDAWIKAVKAIADWPWANGVSTSQEVWLGNFEYLLKSDSDKAFNGALPSQKDIVNPKRILKNTCISHDIPENRIKTENM